MIYVLWTHTGREEHTRELIYEYADPTLYTACVIPYRLKRHWFKGKSHIEKLILFPSYVFIETNHIREFAENIRWFPGFNVFLHSDDFYCPLHFHEEAMLKKLINEQGIIDISQGYMEGDKVRITSGPLLGLEGEIIRVKPRQGCAILRMNIFNRLTEVSLGLEIIQRS